MLLNANGKATVWHTPLLLLLLLLVVLSSWLLYTLRLPSIVSFSLPLLSSSSSVFRNYLGVCTYDSWFFHSLLFCCFVRMLKVVVFKLGVDELVAVSAFSSTPVSALLNCWSMKKLSLKLLVQNWVCFFFFLWVSSESVSLGGSFSCL